MDSDGRCGCSIARAKHRSICGLDVPQLRQGPPVTSFNTTILYYIVLYLSTFDIYIYIYIFIYIYILYIYIMNCLYINASNIYIYNLKIHREYYWPSTIIAILYRYNTQKWCMLFVSRGGSAIGTCWCNPTLRIAAINTAAPTKEIL